MFSQYADVDPIAGQARLKNRYKTRLVCVNKLYFVTLVIGSYNKYIVTCIFVTGNVFLFSLFVDSDAKSRTVKVVIRPTMHTVIDLSRTSTIFL